MLDTRYSPDLGSVEALSRRTRLLDDSIAAAESTVTYLQAPTGYRKTALLQAWQRNRPVEAGLGLYIDAAAIDGDPRSLWAELVHHLDGGGALDASPRPQSIAEIAEPHTRFAGASIDHDIDPRIIIVGAEMRSTGWWANC